MIITATEFKSNLGKYFDLVNNEDIIITKNGKIIAQLTSPQQDKVEILNSLVGLAKGNDLSLDDIKEERLSKQWKYY